MRINKSFLCFILLFFTIFSIFENIIVYGCGTYTMDSSYYILTNGGTQMGNGTRKVEDGCFVEFEISNLQSTDTVLTTIRNEYCKIFQDWAMEKYPDKALITNYKVEYLNTPTADKNPLVTLSTEMLKGEIFGNKVTQGLNPIKITLTVGNSTYIFTSFTREVYLWFPIYDYDDDGVRYNTGQIRKVSVDKNKVKYFLSEDKDCVDNLIANQGRTDGIIVDSAFIEECTAQWQIYEDTLAFMESVRDAVNVGIAAGSVGAGYNVGTVYSSKQVPLTDVMEKTASGGYDFKNLSNMKATFDFFMSPVLGRCDFLSSSLGAVPKTIEEWVTFINEQDVKFIQGNKIVLNAEFQEFESSLIDDQINASGFKKTDTIKFTNGVKRVQNVASSVNPKSVISYNMRICYPHIFVKYGESYSLALSNLRMDPEYTYCVFNDLIFSNDNFTDSVTDRSEIAIGRNQIFLYHQKVNNEYIGIVLMGAFDEAVIDTTTNGNGKIYLTGRKLGFNNGYSDSIKLTQTNYKLLYAQGESGLEGYSLRNISFLAKDASEIDILEDNRDAMAESQDRGNYVAKRIETSDMPIETLLKEIDEMKEHNKIESNPDFIKLFISLTNITYDSNSSSTLAPEKWAVIAVRNNRYVEDSSLITWLRTDTAASLPYVEEDKLLALITGDFSEGLEKLTYDDWKSMESIKAELERNKDMWLVRVMNIMSIVFGTVLIMMAVLLCLFYWIDIFNTFSDISFLKYISFGNLYAVEDKELIPYTSSENSSTRYVVFKDVLVISGILCALGILFLNVTSVISFFVFLFNYILSVLGG